jgi:glyceraldehyde 3-phosphate dehydrogenase
VNGFGRIGRLFVRNALERSGIEVVAVNDITDAATLAHLLRYDSNYGTLPDVSAEGDSIRAGGSMFKVVSQADPARLPWREMGVQVVVESTGRFTSRDKAALHLDAGASKVIISAPAKGEDVTIVLGVNEHTYDPSRHHVASNASCTTNCLAPVVKVLHDAFGVKRGLMTTVHAYTNDQRILDLPHSDLRRARAAGMSIIPTTTGAARAVSLVLPELKGKLNGFALRVPTSTVSLVDFVAELGKPVSEDQVNEAFRRAAEGPMQGILGVSGEPLVSIDYKGCPLSSVVDSLSTMVMEGTMVKVVAWYDNEWAYAGRLCDMVEFVAAKGL